MLTGGSIIFFTYIGFDSVSTAAEECKNPQRDVPFGILMTLAACTALYSAVAIVLSGIVPWQSLMGDAAPVVNALKRLSLQPGGGGLYWIRLFVLLGALVGMISSILVFQLGQARIWFAMSRDKLLPDVFSRIHAQFRTPAVATWVEYRDPVCIRSGFDRRADSSLSRTKPISGIPRAARPCLPGVERRVLHSPDDGPGSDYMVPLLRLAGDGAGDLLLL